MNIMLKNLVWWDNYPLQSIAKSTEHTEKSVIKLQPIFSEASQTGWPESFDFLIGISGFPM